jgi:hypothetical protein
VLTLVSFDVKGAFNSVYLNVLKRRLALRHVPSLAAKWIRNFCNGRYA